MQAITLRYDEPEQLINLNMIIRQKANLHNFVGKRVGLIKTDSTGNCMIGYATITQEICTDCNYQYIFADIRLIQPYAVRTVGIISKWVPDESEYK